MKVIPLFCSPLILFYTPLANPDGSPKPEYYADDKLHLSDAGHARWAELLMPIFEELK